MLALGALGATSAHGIIHMDPANPIYLSNPGNGLPWENVGKISNGPNAAITGTAVSLRGRYCLTAAHMTMRSHVSFDNETYYRIDPDFKPVKIGTADVKVFKLIEDPGLPEIAMITDSSLEVPANLLYLVGWGRGKQPSQTAPVTIGNFSNVWRWGDTATTTKRWGTNRRYTMGTVTSGGYTHSAILAANDSNAAESTEAGLAMNDSGSPLFVKSGANWFLVGIGTSVSSVAGANTSTFGISTSQKDFSYWARLQPLRTQVENAIPATTPYETWLQEHGVFGLDSAPEADPDGDGLANLAEYAFGSDPTVHSLEATPALVVKPDQSVVFQYRLSKTAQGITTRVLHSADLVNWTDAPGTAIVIDDSSPDYTIYQLPVTPDNSSYRFYTLQVSTN